MLILIFIASLVLTFFLSSEDMRPGVCQVHTDKNRIDPGCGAQAVSLAMATVHVHLCTHMCKCMLGGGVLSVAAKEGTFSKHNLGRGSAFYFKQVVGGKGPRGGLLALGLPSVSSFLPPCPSPCVSQGLLF